MFSSFSTKLSSFRSAARRATRASLSLSPIKSRMVPVSSLLAKDDPAPPRRWKSSVASEAHHSDDDDDDDDNGNGHHHRLRNKCDGVAAPTPDGNDGKSTVDDDSNGSSDRAPKQGMLNGHRHAAARNGQQQQQQQQQQQRQQQQHNDDKNDQHELTFSRRKSGTPSPWAVFDPWGDNVVNDASGMAVPPLTKRDHALLSDRAVQIPLTEGERSILPAESDILDSYELLLQNKSSVHFGYPYNLMFDYTELSRFLRYSINNLGDPFVTSNYGVHSRQFECAVIDFFAQLWKMEKDSYWGYVTTSGTEGNLHAILLARELFPDGILYTSRETHYSVFKAARYYRMECNSIPTLPMGEIDYDCLADAVHQNRDRPVILNVNVGTTVKGAVDNLDRILRILNQLEIPRERYYIHCDGALFALMMPFIDFAPEVSFRKPIDSIAVSGHKMLGCPMPCGVTLCRKEHVTKLEQHIDYLNSVDTTIMGSRNGQAALYLWYRLRKKGIDGIKRDVEQCMETARYLRDELAAAGFSCRLNDLSSTVVLERPMDDELIRRWQLACEEDIAHVVVMPNVTRLKIDRFVRELQHSAKAHGRTQPLRKDSPLVQLSRTWGSSSSSRREEEGEERE